MSQHSTQQMEEQQQQMEQEHQIIDVCSLSELLVLQRACKRVYGMQQTEVPKHFHATEY